MNKSLIVILTIFSSFTLISCQRSEEKISKIDNKSYIKGFEFFHKNPTDDSLIKISSPKAILDLSNNDVEIIDSLIEVSNTKGNTIKLNSGKSTLNNSTNLIRVFNNVNISLIESENSFIKTNSLDWDLNTSLINLNSPLYINFTNTIINSSYGSYDIDSSNLKMNNNRFYRSFFNKEGLEKYNIEIKSDIANWTRNDNSIVFTSNNKQVESTINFLSTK